MGFFPKQALQGWLPGWLSVAPQDLGGECPLPRVLALIAEAPGPVASMSFRLAVALDASAGVPGGGAHLAEVPQLEEQPRTEGSIFPEWKKQEVFLQ